MHGSEDLAVPAHAIQQGFEAQDFSVEHGPAAVARKAISGRPDYVDVGGAQRDALAENAKTFVHQREQAALLDLSGTVHTLRYLQLARAAPKDFDGDRKS